MAVPGWVRERQITECRRIFMRAAALGLFLTLPIWYGILLLVLELR